MCRRIGLPASTGRPAFRARLRQARRVRLPVGLIRVRASRLWPLVYRCQYPVYPVARLAAGWPARARPISSDLGRSRARLSAGPDAANWITRPAGRARAPPPGSAAPGLKGAQAGWRQAGVAAGGGPPVLSRRPSGARAGASDQSRALVGAPASDSSGDNATKSDNNSQLSTMPCCWPARALTRSSGKLADTLRRLSHTHTHTHWLLSGSQTGRPSEWAIAGAGQQAGPRRRQLAAKGSLLSGDAVAAASASPDHLNILR